ncbi:hypothetical protein INR49_001128 [Caranx melampygus]|nr:hypothetical protein INR49_001128 [Caranx melampygus]
MVHFSQREERKSHTSPAKPASCLVWPHNNQGLTPKHISAEKPAFLHCAASFPPQWTKSRGSLCQRSAKVTAAKPNAQRGPCAQPRFILSTFDKWRISVSERSGKVTQAQRSLPAARFGHRTARD